MKNFWIATALLLLGVALTVGNAYRVQHELDVLETLAYHETSALVTERFEKNEPFLALTVNRDVLEQANCALSEMRVYEQNAPDDYLAARERFVATLKEIAEGENFSISSIF